MKHYLKFIVRHGFMLLLIILLASACKTQNRCLLLDGVDDHVVLGNIYDSLQFPFTVAAWVKIDSNVTYTFPILVSQDNAPVYNGFWFCITNTNIYIEYGDGRGQNHSAFRRGKSAYVSKDLSGKWIHVAASIRGQSDIDLYVDGELVGGEFGGNSSLLMASNYPDDFAKIGKIYQNDKVWHFKGYLDNVTVWSRSLSPTEVKNFMQHKFTGKEEGLIGHWNFNEKRGIAVFDKSPFHYNGTLQGNVQRVVVKVPED